MKVTIHPSHHPWYPNGWHFRVEHRGKVVIEGRSGTKPTAARLIEDARRVLEAKATSRRRRRRA